MAEIVGSSARLLGPSVAAGVWDVGATEDTEGRVVPLQLSSPNATNTTAILDSFISGPLEMMVDSSRRNPIVFHSPEPYRLQPRFGSSHGRSARSILGECRCRVELSFDSTALSDM